MAGPVKRVHRSRERRFQGAARRERPAPRIVSAASSQYNKVRDFPRTLINQIREHRGVSPAPAMRRDLPRRGQAADPTVSVQQDWLS
jgi:hypothetical protein